MAKEVVCRSQPSGHHRHDSPAWSCQSRSRKNRALFTPLAFGMFQQQKTEPMHASMARVQRWERGAHGLDGEEGTGHVRPVGHARLKVDDLITFSF